STAHSTSLTAAPPLGASSSFLATRRNSMAVRRGFYRPRPPLKRPGPGIPPLPDTRAPRSAAVQNTAACNSHKPNTAPRLADRGFAHPVVIGHSNGGMLAVKHIADHPDTPALVLLSAHTRGTHQVENASRVGLMAGDRLEEIVAEARAMVAGGRGRDLLLMP